MLWMDPTAGWVASKLRSLLPVLMLNTVNWLVRPYPNMAVDFLVIVLESNPWLPQLQHFECCHDYFRCCETSLFFCTHRPLQESSVSELTRKKQEIESRARTMKDQLTGMVRAFLYMGDITWRTLYKETAIGVCHMTDIFHVDKMPVHSVVYKKYEVWSRPWLVWINICQHW